MSLSKNYSKIEVKFTAEFFFIKKYNLITNDINYRNLFL